jgi:hypothetical protein
MPDPDLPREVRELVGRRLQNMEDIDIILLLESSPEPLTASQIRERLRLPEGSQVPGIARLVEQRFIRRDDTSGEARYSYAVTDPETKRAIALLRVAYNERPVTLVRLVYHRPSAAQNFADAFRITKDPTDDR